MRPPRRTIRISPARRHCITPAAACKREASMQAERTSFSRYRGLHRLSCAPVVAAAPASDRCSAGAGQARGARRKRRYIAGAHRRSGGAGLGDIQVQASTSKTPCGCDDIGAAHRRHARSPAPARWRTLHRPVAPRCATQVVEQRRPGLPRDPARNCSLARMLCCCCGSRPGHQR